MTREEAKRLLNATPEFVAGPCPWCGAVTHEEAATKCRPVSDPSGEYHCGTPEQPDPMAETGPLMQSNPEYQRLEGYLWGWFAVDQGFTDTPPEWDETDDN